jgi:hypothetical protein
MQVTFPKETKSFRLENIYRYQEHLGTDNRWSERAFLFRDGSILWETMAFTTFAQDGSRFSTAGTVHRNGAEHLPGRINGSYPLGMVTLIEEIKRVGKRIIAFDAQIWELSLT